MIFRELISLPDGEFIEQLGLLCDGVKNTEYRRIFDNYKDDVDTNREMVKTRLENSDYSSEWERPDLYSLEDIQMMCVCYLEAQKMGKKSSEAYLRLIHKDLELIRKSSTLRRELIKISQYTPQKLTTKLTEQTKGKNEKVSPRHFEPRHYPVTTTRVNAVTKEVSKLSYMNYLTFGDSHGWIEPVKSAFRDANEQFGDNYRMIVVGDVIDRGLEGIQTLQYLMNLGDKVIFMPGNHELMMKNTFDMLKSHNQKKNGEINWQGVRDDLRCILLQMSMKEADGELKKELIFKHGQFMQQYIPEFNEKQYTSDDLNILRLWLDVKNGGKATLPRITGNLVGYREIAEDCVISDAQLASILEYIDRSSLLVPINAVHDSKNPAKTRSVLIGHSNGGTNNELLHKLRKDGLRPQLRAISSKSLINDITSSREEKYRNQPNNPIELVANAGFDEFIHGHEPVSTDKHVESENLEFKGKKIRFTSIDGGMAGPGGMRNKSARLNVYHLNSQTVRQFDRAGNFVGIVDLVNSGRNV